MPDGQRYGPATVQHLNQWIAEGRVLPSTLLEDELTGTRSVAQSLIGLDFGPQMGGATPQTPPQPHQAWPSSAHPAYRPHSFNQPYAMAPLDRSGSLVTVSYILGGVALLSWCSPGLQILLVLTTLVTSIIARMKGERGSGCALGFAIIVLAVIVGAFLLFQAFRNMVPSG